jgi:hypothetical protein
MPLKSAHPVARYAGVAAFCGLGAVIAVIIAFVCVHSGCSVGGAVALGAVGGGFGVWFVFYGARRLYLLVHRGSSPDTELSASQRLIFGVGLPVIAFIIGFMWILGRLDGRRPSAGFGGLALFLLFFPLALVLVVAVNSFALPSRISSRRQAFFLGCMLPAVLLLAELLCTEIILK